ncbi:hypothetical protein [Edaphobacter flagellatus]|uniref:hypothetical protein n=1 Tax=Edaphobacter flagellatus TaxID=1933044 RepID=UPI0021B367B0|nr:hypothetical protein [Edaphobacter flagellatus]
MPNLAEKEKPFTIGYRETYSPFLANFSQEGGLSRMDKTLLMVCRMAANMGNVFPFFPTTMVGFLLPLQFSRPKLQPNTIQLAAY